MTQRTKRMTPEKREELRRQVSPRCRLVTIPMLSAATGDSARTIWRKVKSGALPRPFTYGNKAAWREPEIEKVISKLADKE